MAVFDILLAILGLSVLVIVHETGHFLAARSFGMRVLRYSIGIGPVIARYQPAGSPTIFQVCAIPFMAYVQIAGMNPHEEIDPKDTGSFANQSLTARIVTVLAGPFANYLLASLMIFGLALHGWPSSNASSPMVVAEVEAGSPAGEAGIRPGDIITEAQGEAIATVDDLIRITKPRGGQATTYRVERDGQALEPLVIVPREVDGRGLIGVVAKIERTFAPLGPSEAATKAVVFPMELTMMQLEGISKLIRDRTTEGLTGPVGMGKIVAEQAHAGWVEYLSVLMLLSVALGLFNLLPLPALDGGRFMFLLFEAVTRQRPNEKVEALIHAVGLMLLLALIVYVTVRDVAGT